MAYQTPTVPVPPNPVFVDKAIVEIQTALGTIPWLTHSFGRSYEKETNVSNEIIVEPLVYKGSSEYLTVSMNDNLQAQSWFIVGDQIPIDYEANTYNFYEVETSIVFWANLKKIDSAKGVNYYFAEELKNDVRTLLTNMHPKSSNFEINRIIEDKDDVFSEYTFKQIDKQYFMYPYVGFRVDLNLIVREKC